MMRINEDTSPYEMNGLMGFCGLTHQSPMSYSKFKGSDWWLTPIMVLDLYRSSTAIKNQLSGSHLKTVYVDIDGYKVPALELLYNGVNTFAFKASDRGAFVGKRMHFIRPQKFELK